MRIDIQGPGMALTGEILDYAERRVRFALTRSRSRIKRVSVRLDEGRGVRTDGDNGCRLQVYLKHAVPVLVEDSGPDLFDVIDRAAERAGRSVAMQVERQAGNFQWPVVQSPVEPEDDKSDISR